MANRFPTFETTGRFETSALYQNAEIRSQCDAASNPRKRKLQLPLQKPKISQSAEL